MRGAWSAGFAWPAPEERTHQGSAHRLRCTAIKIPTRRTGWCGQVRDRFASTSMQGDTAWCRCGHRTQVGPRPSRAGYCGPFRSPGAPSPAGRGRSSPTQIASRSPAGQNCRGHRSEALLTRPGSPRRGPHRDARARLSAIPTTPTGLKRTVSRSRSGSGLGTPAGEAQGQCPSGLSCRTERVMHMNPPLRVLLGVTGRSSPASRV
jgi:hypothetical protein